MRLVFKKRINERIVEAIHQAEREGKSIEKIVLTRQENEELEKWCGIYRAVAYGTKNIEFYGHKIEVED